MFLDLIPIELELSALVTIELSIAGKEVAKKTLYKDVLWSYTAPTIRTKIVETIAKEKDNSPPEISSFVDEPFKVNISYVLFSTIMQPFLVTFYSTA